jgi:methylmalonyl-CoA/ethylmalonyl-CoA epimerase
VREPVFVDTLQVAVVVRDLEARMQVYVEKYGIGPWEIYEFNPATVQNMRQDGEPVETSWRLALARVGNVHWELIEPLDDRSTYAQFLASKGEGVHHIGMAAASYDDTLSSVADEGRRVVLSGHYNGVNFAYLPTEDDLGVLTEIFDAAPGEDQQPVATYP